MKKTKLILKSLSFYRRTHLSVLLGTLVTTAILTGALIVGDSVKFSLKRIALLRLGNTQYAIKTNDRFFRQKLATELSDDLNIITAPLLKLDGIAINSSKQTRANKIQVIGVNENFWKIGKTENFTPLSLDPLRSIVHTVSHLNSDYKDSSLGLCQPHFVQGQKHHDSQPTYLTSSTLLFSYLTVRLIRPLVSRVTRNH